MSVEAGQDCSAASRTKAGSWEFRLSEETARRLRRAFPQKPSELVQSELLEALLKEKQARQHLNLNHWAEYGPRFLEGLAEKWKLREAARLAAMPAFLNANRRRALRLALAITANLSNAETAVAEADFDYLTGAVEDAGYPLAVEKYALGVGRSPADSQNVPNPDRR